MAFFYVFVAMLVCVSVSVAADYYVAMDGDDDNPGTSGEPWATIQHAADTAAAGDTIHVMAGYYTQTARFTHPGAPGNLIRCVAEGSVTVDAGGADWGLFVDGYEDNNGRYVEIAGFIVTGADRGGVRISWADGTVIRNCECFGNGRWGIFTDYADDIQLLDNTCHNNIDEHGIYVSNSGDRPTIRGNICYGNNASGIQINADPAMPGDGITSDALVENNICYDNGSAGGAAINLASVRDSVIRNNLLFGNHAGGIAGWGDGNGPDWGCKNDVFVNNTIIFDARDGRCCMSHKEARTNAVILNNILIGGDDGALEFDTDSLAGMLSDYNIMHSLSGDVVVTEEDISYLTLPQWQAGGQDAHTFNVDPGTLFISQGDPGGFQLNPGTAAVDSGAEAHPDIPSTDRIGFSRCDDPDTVNTGEGSGITDRGCHERCAGMPTPTPGVSPTPGDTPTPTGTPEPTPTYTPLPVTVDVRVSMPYSMYAAGTPCWCVVFVTIDGESPLIGHPLFVLLDVFGQYFYAPSFNSEYDNYLEIYPEFTPGETSVTVIDMFEWPSGAGAASGIVWYAAITDPEVTVIRGNVGSFEFGWQ